MPSYCNSGRHVIIVLSYYTPYVSGLTNVARDIAESLVTRGWQITIVTTQHQPDLPLEEIINGVHVVRTPVLFRIGKGAISPSFISTIRRESISANLVNIHAPMLEAGVVSKLIKSPIVLTYQCDVSLPTTLFGRIQNGALDFSTRVAARNSNVVSVTSNDYADHSRVRDALSFNREVIVPPCHLREGGNPVFRDGPGLHVGFLGRIVEEKGIEYLVEGFSALPCKNARLLIAGDFSAVAGGSVIRKVREQIGKDTRIKLLGFLPDKVIIDFYRSLDVFALPSVNSFEAFGIVQVEAMMLGIPVIASDLPGVRQPVLLTGMGQLVQPRSAIAITDALKRLMISHSDFVQKATFAREIYASNLTLDKFEKLFSKVIAEGRTRKYNGV